MGRLGNKALHRRLKRMVGVVQELILPPQERKQVVVGFQIGIIGLDPRGAEGFQGRGHRGRPTGGLEVVQG